MTSSRPFARIASVFGGAFAIAAAVGAFVLTDAPTARAQVAAKVESQTRPNFGILLDPPTRSYRSRGTSHRRYDYGRHRPDWRPGYPGGYQRGEEVVLVDCGGNPGSGAVEDAVRRVRPGGTLVIRARGGACVGWLNIDKPMIVIGEAGFDVRRGVRGEPTLMAPDGLPCVTVAQGVRVEFRDMIFAAPRAGDAACIVGYGGEIVMNRVGITYAGDEAAIYSDGGLVDLRDVAIDAQTVTAAVIVDGATLTTDEVLITGAQSGIEVSAGEGPPTRINRTRLLGPERPNNFGPRSIGLLVEARRDYGEIAITNSKICGYPDAMSVEGATVRVDRVRICKAQKGVIVYNGEVNVDHSRIVAMDTGVLVVSGNGLVSNSILAGMERPMYAERGRIGGHNIHVWSEFDCRPRFERRYGNRYAPVWGSRPDQDYTCHGDPYPRDWWARDEQALNVPYNSRVAYPQGWESYSRGQGWYDCRDRYVSDSRYSFDDRWRQGPRGWTQECRRLPGEPLFDWGFDARIGVSAHVSPPPPPSYDIDFDSGFDFGL